ncbi:MAG: hypothetical protein ACLQBQ_01050 [Smithella sp.]
MEKKRVIFICTNNSVRSQMAKAILNYFYGKRYDAFSDSIGKADYYVSAERITGRYC